MYSELYEIWKQELENIELEKLPPNFYSKIADYLRKLKEESRMLDKRTAKANLLNKELKNAKRMIKDLIKARQKKLAKKIVKSEKVPLDSLTAEETRVYTGILPFMEAYSRFLKEILSGRSAIISVVQIHKRLLLRFLKDTPSIIGADMKTYGPFKTEDIASLPVENAKIMAKQGLAEYVEVK